MRPKKRWQRLYLWQRLFLCALAFCLLSGIVTALVLQSASFSASVTREEENAVALHGLFASTLSATVIKDGLPEAGSFSAVGLRNEEGTAVAGELPLPDEDVQAFAASAAASDGYLTRLETNDGRTLLLVGSSLTWGGKRYALLSARDVTSLYADHRSRAMSALRAILLGSLLIAAALSLLCILFLLPLSRVNRALKRLSSGERDLQLPERGGQELRSLIANVNAMAVATEEQTRLLQETADSRKRFADSMAHEMKTPLTSILCMADVLRIKRSVTDAERRDYAGVIVEEAKRMRALSSKLLTLASADGTAPDFRDCALTELLEEVRAAMVPILERRAIRLTFAGEDVTLSVDRQLFQTLLINLIDNAAKASSDGQQVLLYHTVQDGMLLLAVVDEGIGMSEEEVRRATEAFWMADKSRSRKEGGAGLGLSLCKEIVKLHDAAMTITSEPGKGTTVQLTIPLRQKAREPAPKTEKGPV